MHFLRVAGSAIALILLTSPFGWAESRRELAWNQVGSVIGKHVKIAMPDGALLEGFATSVESESLVMDVGKTRGSQKYATGPLTLPRTALKQMQIEDSHVRWRVKGVAIGTGLGLMSMFAGNFVASDRGLFGGCCQERQYGRATGFYALAVAFPVAGYFLGKKGDRHWTTVTILP